MYETYTKQSLPTKEYRELVGTALCVFCSNNAFMIENIIKTDDSYDWYDLMDKESGGLKNDISKTISQNSNDEIFNLFSEIVTMRNRIFHSFRITSEDGEQILATKSLKRDGNIQFHITKEYLMEFINKNDKLSDLLYQYRRDKSLK